MKILMVESQKSDLITTKFLITAHVIATYLDANEETDTIDEFMFEEFDDGPSASESFADILNQWDLQLSADSSDVAKFKNVKVTDAYFEDEKDGNTGVIEVVVNVESKHELTKDNLNYLKDAVMELIIDEASALVYGSWYGEVEYWDGYSYEPSYKMSDGKINEQCEVKLNTRIPTTYKIL